MKSSRRFLTVLALLLTMMLGLTACGGSDSSSGTSSTVTAPAITTQPTSLSVTSSNSGTFTVVATGTSLTYQWYNASGSISSATSASYSTSTAGSYYVIVSNSAGSVTSSTATLTVSTSTSTSTPSITTQPVATSVTVGSSVSLTVVATGTDLTYQWYKDSAAVSGATSATYTIDAATSSDAGTYYVIVTNTAGTATSSSVALTVTTTATGSNTAAVVTAANSFLDTLSTTQKTVATSSSSSSTVLFNRTLANSIVWTNLPGGRHGLRLNTSTLTTTQLAAANALITAALSTAGNTLMAEIRASDDVIAASTTNSPWGSTLYSIAFIGTPSTTSAWMLQLTGHHLAYNITYNASYASATPMFIGVEPPNWVGDSAPYTVNNTAATSGSAHAPLEAQRLAVSNLAISLQADSTTATSARLSGTFTDVIMGVTNSGDSNYGSLSWPTSGRGALYSSLTSAQQALVQAAIEAWANTQASDVATALLAAYESDTALASTYVGFAVGQGGTADFSAYPNSLTTPLNAQHSYLRIDGPRVWIEMVVQQGVAYPTYVHYHSLWRDKTADYGGGF